MLNNLDDKALFDLVKADNRQAFTELFNRYWLPLYQAAFRRIKDGDQSQDIVQEIFTDLWSRRAGLSINSIQAYLHTAVRFQVYKLVAKEAVSSEFYTLFTQMAGSPFGADAVVREKEMAALINAWLDALPEKRRRIVLIHLSTEESTAEIARRLDVSVKTVQNQWGTALRDLRNRLSDFMLLIIF